MKKNNIFIISGPSGAGEDTIIQALKEQLNIEKIITSTTRAMRDGEVNGVDYYFLSKEEFLQGIKDKKFLEYAQEYNNNFYGVTKSEIERVLNCDKIGIWKIEYKGVKKAKKLFPNIISIFINAPLNQIEERIRRRDNVTEEYISERMNYTKEWLKHLDIYDYEVVNEDGKLDKAVQKIKDIIKANS